MKKYLGLLGMVLLIAGLSSACQSTKNGPRGSTRIYDAENEQVDVGYGSISNQEVTTAVAEVNPKQPNLDLLTYLRRVPGIQITGSGSSARIRIRGLNSLEVNDPLFVVDGMPIGNSYQDVENSVSVNDIKNISVLKDGGSASIYGTRGNNGVILITTKKK